MARKSRIMLLALVVIVVLANVSLIVLSTGRPPARPPLPNPNGYDDFLKAATLSTGDLRGAGALGHDGLQAFVSMNSESRRLLRLGLTRECALAPESALTNVPAILSQLAGLRRLAYLLEAEGRLREWDNRLADAAQSYVDAIHFGNEMSRGGFVVNRNVGTLCEVIGGTALSRLVPKLNPEEAGRVIAELEKIDTAGVTWDEVRRNESRFARYEYKFVRQLLGGWFNAITLTMTRWVDAWRGRKQAELRHRQVVAHMRLLTAELALRCYQSEQGRAPTGLEQLVPQYLQRVPSDPFSGRPVIYRLQGTNWLLYSVGEDGADNGGKRLGRPGSGAVTRGDLFYDSPY
jgi:hypothetical protein